MFTSWAIALPKFGTVSTYCAMSPNAIGSPAFFPGVTLVSADAAVSDGSVAVISAVVSLTDSCAPVSPLV